ncbi:MAG: ABC transporter ATP-binding protein [Solirubrobacteraceae bacterium]
MSDAVLELVNVQTYFPVHQGFFARKEVATVKAVNGVTLTVRRGEVLGLVGESGCGKSTLARTIMQLVPLTGGAVVLNGQNLAACSRRELLASRHEMQMVFQDPFGSLDPRWRVADIVGEPLFCYGVGDRASRRRRVGEVLELVGLDPAVFGARRPRQLSGGQRQRVAIARALALAPALIVCDEAVSSLDVLIRAQVLNLLERLRCELGLSYLFIAHDLALVKQVSDSVAVMHLGKLVEVGPAEEIYRRPRHPYTVALLASIPSPDPTAVRAPVGDRIRGEPPSPIDPPSGCRFRTRCPRVQELCAEQEPPLRELSPGHRTACHFPVSDDDETEAEPALAAPGSRTDEQGRNR